jgi:hypothetical protein
VPQFAPCHPDDNTFYHHGNAYRVSSVTKAEPEHGGKYRVVAYSDASSITMSIEFNKIQPFNGVYITEQYAGAFQYNRNRKQVYVKIDQIDEYPVENYMNVYVAENANGSYTISFCDLNNAHLSLSGRFTFPQ